jgi:hypothetical protein
VNQIECRHEADDEVLRQYVSGQLSDAAAEAFEEHMFDCDRCADEVQRAIEIRAALAGAPASAGHRLKPVLHIPLAVAAVAAAVAIGLWQFQSRQLSPPPLRSVSSREIAATGRVVGTIFNASWNVIPNARSYRVQVFNSLGEPVTWTETSSTKFSAPIGAASRGEPRYWKVQALNDDHVVIASSQLIKIQ